MYRPIADEDKLFLD